MMIYGARSCQLLKFIWHRPKCEPSETESNVIIIEIESLIEMWPMIKNETCIRRTSVSKVNFPNFIVMNTVSFFRGVIG